MRSVETLHLGRTGINNFSSIDIPVLEEFCVGKRVLDIGCANGDVVKYLRGKNTEAYGVDGDTYAINTFSDPSIRDYLLCHDYTKGESNISKSIAVVISTDFCEHVHEDYASNYMRDFLLGKIMILHTPPKGTQGHHHVNTQDSEYWILLFAQYGARFDNKLTEEVRRISDYHNPVHMSYFDRHPEILPKNNYLVFRKK